jgi:parallel beta-helix repeat protein
VAGLTVFWPASSTAQTDHTGTCSGTFAAAGNPHRLTGDCTVPAGETLTLEAGVLLEGQNRRLFVEGALEADAATFQDVDAEYRSGSSGTVENSSFAGSSSVRLAGASAAPVLDGNTIDAGDRFDLAAIDVGGTAQPMITNNTITSVRVGVLCRDNAAPTISGNDIRGTGSGIEVTGSARPVITNNTITMVQGRSVAISFDGTTAGEARGNTIGFGFSSAGLRSGIDLSGQAAPVIDGNVINDFPGVSDIGIGIRTAAAAAPTVINNSVCATGDDRPLLVTPTFFDRQSNAVVAGNDFPCDLRLVAIDGGTLTGEGVMREADGISSFLLISTFFVGSSAALSVGPDVTFAARGNSLTVRGSLNADGVAFANTRIDLDPGSSGTIAGSSFTSGPGFGPSIVDVNGATLVLTNSSIEGSGTAVVVAGMSDVSANGNVFTGNTRVFDLSAASQAEVAVSSNVFDDNTFSLAFFPNAQALFSGLPSDFDTNTFIGAADRNTIHMAANLNVSGTLRSAPIPYFCDRAITVAAAASVMMEPGTAIQGNGSCGFTVTGELLAVGTRESPVIFTATRPQDGVRWRGIAIQNKTAVSPSVLENCIVEFAGGLNRPGVLFDNASIPVRNCVIADNNRNGIELVNGSAPNIQGTAILQNLNHGILSSGGSVPVVQGGSIFGNGGSGIQNDDASIIINAENNYWGDDSGPFDLLSDTRCNTLSNPDGLGEEVSDCVDFDPFIRLNPSIAGSLSVISGDGQQGELGEMLAEPLTVEIRSTLGSPLEGIDVLFSIVEGDASFLEPQPLQTGMDGRASTTVQLGRTPGDILVSVSARDSDNPLSTFMAEPEGPCLITLQALAPPGWICPGDCDEGGEVTIDELMNGVRVALGEASLDACPSFDMSSEGDVTIDELIGSVNAALSGCPA